MTSRTQARHRGRVVAISCVFALIGVVTFGDSRAHASGADAVEEEEKSIVSLADPLEAGHGDVQGRRLDILSSTDEPAETVIVSRLVTGEVSTTVVQRLPKATARTFDASTDEPLTVTADNHGPSREEVVSTLLQDAPDNWHPAFAYTVGETSASFAWYAAASDFEVWLDGELQSVSSEGTATVSRLTPGREYRLELQGEVEGIDRPVPSSRILNIATHSANGDPLSNEGIPKTYQKYTTAVSYRTFIDSSSVDASMCNWGDRSYTFDGDGRGWDFPGRGEPLQTPNYRTLMAFNVNWENPRPYHVIQTKNVGQSVTRKNGTVVNASYAGMDQMLFQEVSSSGAYAQVRLNHTATNPHCKFLNIHDGGAIRYNVVFRVYRSGTIEMVGWRRPAPHHEVYVRWNRPNGTEFWQTIMRRGIEGFHCLADNACRVDNYNDSISY